MNTSCPVCGKAVDPLRARNVGVRAGKVVAYCSPECAREAETKPTVMPTAAPKPRTPAGGVPKVTVTLDSGPVIEIIHEPASGVVVPAAPKVAPPKVAPPKVAEPKAKIEASSAKPARDDTTLRKWTVEDDEAVPDPDRSGVRISDFEERRKREATAVPTTSHRGLIILAVLLVVGAGAFAIYRFVLVKKPEPSSSVHHPPPKPTPPEEPATPPPVAHPDPGAALAQAEKVLRDNLASESPRVQRVAAAALARTKDSPAIELLAAALAKETVEVAKLEIAYALARGGDARGHAALVAGLGSGRRDVKLEAGRRLAQLGDEKAAPVLGAYLEVSQLRLGAAEQLAYLKDQRALDALDAIRTDAKTSRDERARATIALGIAGRKDVIPDLQALLKDSHFNAFAASALAQLGDPTARAVLAEQLAVPSLRVEAARALRRLEPGLDPGLLLVDLVASLANNKDTEQVQIAEAILLLAGDLAWSERP